GGGRPAGGWRGGKWPPRSVLSSPFVGGISGRALLPRLSRRLPMYEVAVIGAGVAGLCTAARLQARGLSTIVFEAHGSPGGCAGYFRRRGFAFAVGAPTLVHFELVCVGGGMLHAIVLPPVHGERLPGYVAWPADRRVPVSRDPALWRDERLGTLGSSSHHHRFWQLLDRLAEVFGPASRAGLRLPLRGAADLLRALGCVGWEGLPLLGYLR